MILFPCEACGKVICADDQSANQHLPCPYCQKMLTVPAESVVDCCLVYRDPRQPNGEPMSSAELQEQLEAGNLHANDLIWTQQVWRPLTQVLNLPLTVSAPQNDLPEIAVRFDELAPLPGFAPLPKFGRHKKRPAKDSAVAATDAAPKTPVGERIKKFAFALVALGVCVFGVVRALRIFNYATKRLASVMIYNGTTTDIVFQLPFSGFDPSPAAAESHATRENLVVGLPCRKTMKIWTVSGNLFSMDYSQLGAPVAELSVPIRPCHDTVVNYGQVPFPVYRNLEELSQPDALVTQEQCQTVVRELASNAAPLQARKLFNQVQKRVREHLVKMVNDSFITDQEYDLTALKIASGERVKSNNPPSSTNTDCVLLPDNIAQSFPNGVFTIRGEAELVILTLNRLTANFRPPIPGVEFGASGQLNITQSADGTLRLEMQLFQSRGADNPEQYRGNWQYVATESPTGEWSWFWTFEKDKQTIRIEADGTISDMK
ncbi:MAG: hypothetical protein J5654_11535 [Victivallales bacterium]|nr:hypothetical protein [Victivallales bacterium]